MDRIISNFYHSFHDFSAYAVSNGLALIRVFQKGSSLQPLRITIFYIAVNGNDWK